MAMQLAGSVYNELGGPINGATVNVKNEAGTTVASTTTGPTGSWSATGLVSTDAHTVEITLAGSQVRKLRGDISVQVDEIVATGKIELANGGSLVIPAGIVTDTEIGNRTIDPVTPPTGNTGSLTWFLNGLANRIWEIVGGSFWRSNPPINLVQTRAHVDATQAHGVTGAVVGTGGAQTLAGPKSLTSPIIGDFTNAQHNHTSAAQGGNTSMQTAVGNVGTGNFTTTYCLIPSASQLLTVHINGLLRDGASLASPTQVNFNETRVAGDRVVVKYVAS